MLCISGAQFALQRAEADLGQGVAGNDADALRSVCEAAWWISAVDEMLRTAHNRMYTDARSTSGKSDEIKGLRWVRNRITHQDAHWTVVASPFVWANEAGIPKGINDNGRAEYQIGLQGRNVIGSIREVLGWIETFAAKCSG